MTLNRIMGGALASLSLIIVGCSGNSFDGNDYLSRGPASKEPTYYGKPTEIPSSEAVTVSAGARFKYRQLSFSGPGAMNFLNGVSPDANSLPIAFAEFHVYNAAGERIQQGETTTKGLMEFRIPKVVGLYTLKVFSRAHNNYLKASILEDIYSNTPYSISKTFQISASHIASGTLDISSIPLMAQADEVMYPKIEGGAFNIMYNILLANEYVRRNIDKNGSLNDGVAPTSLVADDHEDWWVAKKVSVYWKAGFNPYTYFQQSEAVSFYTPSDKKLYILGGVKGSVQRADTDHFDDSIILHEYAHFLEDNYSRSESPGGSHNANFVIDPRLAWSEGWANYFQSAVLTGAAAFAKSNPDNEIPNNRSNFYVDTFGYGAGSGLGMAFSLIDEGSTASRDRVGGDLHGGGTFREVSVARSLYKSSRSPSSTYSGTLRGGGLDFKDFWMVLTGTKKGVYTSTNPSPYSFVTRSPQSSYSPLFPIPNMGLFNWLLEKNGAADSNTSTAWGKILEEEKQKASTEDYAYFLDKSSTLCPTTFTTSKEESVMPGSNLKRSDQLVNNDFYLYWHDGSPGTLRMEYSKDSGAPLDLDLILYYKSYIYFEDHQWYSGLSNPYVARQSRNFNDNGVESVSLNGLPAGYYILNVKVNAFNKNKNAELVGQATYQLSKGSDNLCGKERP